MKEEVIKVVEEGGLVAYASIDTEIIKTYKVNAEIHCPICDYIMELNGRCKTCINCGWSSCDI